MQTTLKAHAETLSLGLADYCADNGISDIRLLDAINSALGELEPNTKKTKEDKTAMRYRKAGKTKGETVSVTVKASTVYDSTINIALRFAVYNDILCNMEVDLIHGTQEVQTVPEIFADWLKKFSAVEVKKIA